MVSRHHSAHLQTLQQHSLANTATNSKAMKYVPSPYLRQSDDSIDRQENRMQIQCFLNKALNQILEDTHLSVLHSVGKPYLNDPLTAGVDEGLSRNGVAAAVDCTILMIGMIPVCAASLHGHFSKRRNYATAKKVRKLRSI